MKTFISIQNFRMIKNFSEKKKKEKIKIELPIKVNSAPAPIISSISLFCFFL
jgi:hypothetical protein